MTQTVERSLTDKQEAFCAWYVALAGNGTQAVLKAGYDCTDDTARSMAPELLALPSIQARLQRIRDSQYTAKQAHADVSERKRLLADIARSNHETLLTAGQRIAAMQELNKMEHVYETATSINIAVIPDAQAKLMALLDKRACLGTNGTDIPQNGTPIGTEGVGDG